MLIELSHTHIVVSYLQRVEHEEDVPDRLQVETAGEQAGQPGQPHQQGQPQVQMEADPGTWIK